MRYNYLINIFCFTKNTFQMAEYTPTYDKFFSMTDDELRQELRRYGVIVSNSTREVMITRLVMFVLEGKTPHLPQPTTPKIILPPKPDSKRTQLTTLSKHKIKRDSSDSSNSSSDGKNENENEHPQETWHERMRRQRKERNEQEKQAHTDKLIADIERLSISTKQSVSSPSTNTPTTITGNGIGSLLEKHKHEDKLRDKYNKLTVAVLKMLIQKRGIKSKQGLKKSRLIDLLVKDNVNITVSTDTPTQSSMSPQVNEHEQTIEPTKRTYVEDAGFESKLKELFEMNKDEKMEELEQQS
jgi:hypothetical protein